MRTKPFGITINEEGLTMWLIEDEDKRFISDRNDVGFAARLLQDARQQRELTLIVGNGPSQSASWLHGERLRGSAGLAPGAAVDVSWSGVVKRAAAEATRKYLKPEVIDGNRNNLALAQAVLVAYEKANRDIHSARQDLVSALNAAFNQVIAPTAIDQVFAALAPLDIVTTNYDFQLERAFEQFAPRQWAAFVRHGEWRSESDESTWIHKMHGSFKPGSPTESRYRFSESFPRARPESSIVITESDYDDCYREIGRANVETSSLMRALSKTCLIIGKSLDPQDISFMYALRKTRTARMKARQEAFMLCNEAPTWSDQLHFHNLGIRPLVVNLPRVRANGHYYFGCLAALARLFPDLGKEFERAMEDPIAGFLDLVRGPDALAIGLASRNITGRTSYLGDNIIPPPGRRNMRYSDVEEHVGGAAMTPLMILAMLSAAGNHRLSLVSAIGKEGDTYSEEILRTCKYLHIDVDAVSRNQDSSWHSTVLVHTSETHDGTKYPGQRIFLDRGYEGRVELAPPETMQLRAQLAHRNLRLVYLDKFMAAQHPLPARAEALVAESVGPMLREENLAVLRRAIRERPQIDVVYETGGGGSAFQHVEKPLSPLVNIFTAGFPFFASVVLHKLGWALPDSLKVFDPGTKWWEADFKHETAAIAELLGQLVGPSAMTPTAPRVMRFDVPAELLAEACRWAGRVSVAGDSQRRWFVTTLHHFGALGIDLNRETGWFCRAPALEDGQAIENTSGAGDTLRAGLMYALLSATRNDEESLARALCFATDVATARCCHFKIVDACKQIEARFAGRYPDYESMSLP